MSEDRKGQKRTSKDRQKRMSEDSRLGRIKTEKDRKG